MKKLLFLSTLLFIGLTLSGCFHKKTTNLQTSKSTASESPQINFQNPKKSAHYESNTPEHGSTLAQVPVNVVINFNFDLAKPSNISITKDGKEYGIGETTIDTNKLTLRRNVAQGAPNGIYTVNYKACWPDGSCHEGSFQFAIDRSKTAEYVNMTNQSAVTIDMIDITFVPRNIKISKGTKVTWTNSNSVSHYVNTDSHPAHTYLLDQNSKELKPGDSYTYTFVSSGIYPYHCSAHAEQMVGQILVE